MSLCLGPIKSSKGGVGGCSLEIELVQREAWQNYDPESYIWMPQMNQKIEKLTELE